MKLVALLTDFGLQDAYVGVMKAVMLKISPAIRLVDICHTVAPHDIRRAAFLLKSSYAYFPKHTVFLTVVDPGVGLKSRRAIIIQAGAYTFVGPDNGVMSLAAEEAGIKRIIEITNERYFLKPVSSTFHGRDIFAPVAAHLCAGKSPAVFGRPVKHITRCPIPAVAFKNGRLKGEIIFIDTFGNLITNIGRESVAQYFKSRPLSIHFKGQAVDGVSRAYAQGAPGELIAVWGSFDTLELAVNQGSAAKKYHARIGDAVIVKKV